jgi:hypothetical protein
VADTPIDEPDEFMEPVTVHTMDLNVSESVVHHWINRGLKLTCETASHPYHEAWLQEMPMQQ